MIYLLILFCLSLAFAILWLIAERQSRRWRVLAGVLAIICALPLGISIGAFIGRYGDAMCYSDTIAILGERAGQAAASKQPQAMADLAKLIKELPLRGYESDCMEIKTAVNTWHASSPSTPKEAAR